MSEKRYRFAIEPSPPDTPIPTVRVELLETTPERVKCITKSYQDGRTLSLHVVDDVILAKRMSFPIRRDPNVMKEERRKGGQVSFKWFERNGLEVRLTYYGTYLVSSTYSLNKKCKEIFPQLFPDDWHDELESDIPFPFVNLDKVELQDGYSADMYENERMAGFFEEDILDGIWRNDEKENKKAVVLDVSNTPDKDKDTNYKDIKCEYCGECPCVWMVERQAVIDNDLVQHAGTTTPNSTRRRVGFKHMWRVVFGVGQNGVRTRNPECVEVGVRAQFPDNKYMGFKED
jgi:hypothetical protein